MDARAIVENASDRLTNIGIEMHRIENLDVAAPALQLREGAADGFESGAEALPSMSGDQNQRFVPMKKVILLVECRGEISIAFQLIANVQQRIDDGVSRDVGQFFRNTFAQQIVP